MPKGGLVSIWKLYINLAHTLIYTLQFITLLSQAGYTDQGKAEIQVIKFKNHTPLTLSKELCALAHEKVCSFPAGTNKV